MTSQSPINALPAQPAIPSNNDDLCKEITRLAGHINAAEHRFLILLGALIERDAWDGGSGFRTPAHWLNYYCGIDLGAAREKVRVARCLPNLPLISEAFRNGTLSYSKVRAMTRVANNDNETYLLGIAEQGTADHVEKLVRKFQRVQHQTAICQDEQRHEDRELTWHHDEDGMMIIKARLEPEEGAVFLKAMEAMLQSMFRKAVKEEPEATPETGRESTTDVSAAETSLEETPDAPESVSAETRNSHISTLENGGACFPLSRTTAKRLVCDASLVTVMEDGEGNILNVGRKTRTVPPAIRRALNIRDKTCQFPGCCQSRFLDAHHIQH